jgi:hypothetical protein
MFAPASIELSGGLRIAAPVEETFPLFSPEGEKLWVPGWAPELLHPPHCEWERGLIFRTQEERGEAVWVVTGLDRPRHEVEYYRVEPGRWVARVRVRCQATGSEQTDVAVTYTFVGLSEAGNQDIAAMSKAAYEQKMSRWQAWISTYLSSSRT